MPRLIRLSLSGSLAAIALSFALVGAALAHAVLVENSLGSKPLAPNAPVNVTLRFNAALEQSFFRATLAGPGKEQRELETMPGKDQSEEIIKLPALKPGKYAITYKVLATDSHLTEAILRFTVAPAQ